MKHFWTCKGCNRRATRLNSTMFRWNHINHTNLPKQFLLSLNSTMFRWNYFFTFRPPLLEFGLNSTMFRWNNIQSSLTSQAFSMFKFHYVQMKLKPIKHIFTTPLSLNSTMFRWNNEKDIRKYDIGSIKFKFHYVQMKHFWTCKGCNRRATRLNSTMFRWNIFFILFFLFFKKV